MGKFNTYRYLVLEDVDELRGGSRRRQRPAGRFQRLFLLCLFIGVLLFIGFYSTLLNPLIDYAAVKLGYRDTIYAVIIDTNAIRSELYIYKFHKYLFGNKLCLDNEVFVKSKPGLMSGVYDNTKGEQVHNLLKQACNDIIFSPKVVTPLILRATSVPTSYPVMEMYRVNSLIKGYFDYVSYIGSPFFIRPEYFSILKKPEEVLDKWIAVNNLLDNKCNLVVLDMDDDSLHLVQQMTSVSDVTQERTVYQPGSKGRVPVFINSYPGLGLMAARLGVLQLENPGSSMNFNSSCINPIIKNQVWSYGQNEFIINGPTKPQYMNIKETWVSVSSHVPVVNVSLCEELMKKYVFEKVDKLLVPQLPKDQNLYFFGHFFNQAADLGLIDVLKGGNVAVSSLFEQRIPECVSPNIDQPWVCFDLIYLYVLMQKMLGHDARYQLATEINNHRVSWALGAAYRILDGLVLEDSTIL